MTKFAYTFSVAAMTLTALLASPNTAFAGEATVSAAAVGTAPVKVGQMLFAAGGKRLAPVYSVRADGNPQVILEGKLFTVPAATLSSADGKLTTSLSKAEVTARKP